MHLEFQTNLKLLFIYKKFILNIIYSIYKYNAIKLISVTWCTCIFKYTKRYRYKHRKY